MLNGSVSNTAQEEAEQLALYFQLAEKIYPIRLENTPVLPSDSFRNRNRGN